MHIQIRVNELWQICCMIYCNFYLVGKKLTLDVGEYFKVSHKHSRMKVHFDAIRI